MAGGLFGRARELHGEAVYAGSRHPDGAYRVILSSESTTSVFTQMVSGRVERRLRPHGDEEVRCPTLRSKHSYNHRCTVTTIDAQLLPLLHRLLRAQLFPGYGRLVCSCLAFSSMYIRPRARDRAPQLNLFCY